MLTVDTVVLTDTAAQQWTDPDVYYAVPQSRISTTVLLAFSHAAHFKRRCPLSDSPAVQLYFLFTMYGEFQRDSLRPVCMQINAQVR